MPIESKEESVDTSCSLTDNPWMLSEFSITDMIHEEKNTVFLLEEGSHIRPATCFIDDDIDRVIPPKTAIPEPREDPECIHRVATYHVNPFDIRLTLASCKSTREPGHRMSSPDETARILVHDPLRSSSIRMMDILPCEKENVHRENYFGSRRAQYFL